MDIIYNKVKQGKPVSASEFLAVIDDMINDGCDVVVLGCTELSVIKSDLKLNQHNIVDSLDVLSKCSIELCEKKVKQECF